MQGSIISLAKHLQQMFLTDSVGQYCIAVASNILSQWKYWAAATPNPARSSTELFKLSQVNLNKTNKDLIVWSAAYLVRHTLL